MPWPTERLNKRSSKEAIDEAVSACISFLAEEKPEWENKRRVAACIADARRNAGASKVPKK